MRLRSKLQGIWRSVRSDPLTAALVLGVVLAVAELLLGAVHAGVTTDEPVHTYRLDRYLRDGWYMPEGYGDPVQGLSVANPFIYGPCFALLAHAANFLVGNEALNDTSSAAAAVDVRHLVIALTSLLAVAGVGAVVWRTTRSWRFGLFTAAGLLVLPLWMGHSFFNIKDVPAAAGYTLVTVSLAIALIESGGGGGREGWPWRLAVGGTMWAGFFVGAGTRLSLWLPFAISIAVYLALRLGQRYVGGVPGRRDLDLAVLGGALAGVLSIAAAYPNAARTPLLLLSESVSASASYPYEGFTLIAGRFVDETPPWWFLPTIFGGTEPLLLGGLLLVGLVAALVALGGALRRAPRSRLWRLPELGLVLAGIQMLMLPVGTIVTHAVTYGGLRQHIYVLPMLALLSGYGAARLWRWAIPEGGGSVLSRRIVAAILALALLMPLAEETILFPYNYAYVNPVASVGGVEDRWETDYWFASVPEAMSRVPADATLVCSDFLVPGWEPDGEMALRDCDGAQFDPYQHLRGTDVKPGTAGGEDVWLIARKRGANHLPPYCEAVDDVTRWLRGEEVTMSFVARCDPDRLPEH